MPVLNGSITAAGPLVSVEVGMSRTTAAARRQALAPVPPPRPAQALIDTGAEISHIDTQLVAQLGLSPGNFALTNAPALGGLGLALQYDISLTVLHPSGPPNHLTISDLLVQDLSLGTFGIDLLLGRDVLVGCILLYDGTANLFRLAYP